MIDLSRRNIVTKNFSLILSLFFVLSPFNPAFSQSNSVEKNTLQVNGKGQIVVEPDLANLTMSVETTNPNASDAVRENADKINKVLEALKSQVGKEGKISTSSYRLVPVYTYDENTKKSVLTGYRVSNSIDIETKNLREIGTLIDTASQAGANRIESLSFDTDKRDEYRRQALVKAVQDAKETAETVANAAGVSILKIIQIKPSSDIPVPIYKEFATSARVSAAPPPTQIEPGELTVKASVNIVYEIQ